jgi:hypothetical protein
LWKCSRRASVYSQKGAERRDNMNRSTKMLIALAILVSILAVPVSSTTWNLADDWSSTSNQSGAWTYGFAGSIASGYTFIPMPAFNNTAIGGFQLWHSGAGDLTPLIGKNVTSSPQAIGPMVPPGKVVMHPSDSNQPAIARWTAPATGNYSIDVVFHYLDTAQDGTDPHIIKNTTESLASGLCTPASPYMSYTQVQHLTAGETLDFCIGRGGAHYYADATQVDLTIATAAAGFLSGTVSGPSGILAGASVAAGGVTVTTGTDGTYSILLPVGSYTVSAVKSGYNAQEFTGVAVNDNDTTTQDFSLTERRGIHGYVYTTGGVVVSGATVTILGGETTTTDSAGYYSLYVATDGTYTMSAKKGLYTEDVQSVVVSGGTTQDFNIVEKVVNWVQTGTAIAGPMTAAGEGGSTTGVARYSGVRPFPIDLAVIGGDVKNLKVTYHVKVDGIPGWGPQTIGVGGLAMFMPGTPDTAAGSPGLYSGDVQFIRTSDWSYWDFGAAVINSPIMSVPQTGSALGEHTNDFDVTLEVITGTARVTVIDTVTPAYTTVSLYDVTATDAANWTGKFNFAAFKCGNGAPGNDWRYGVATISNITFYRDADQTPPAQGTISGVVTRNFGDHRAIEGVTISSPEGYTTTTDSAGYYSIRVLAGTHSLTASKPWFASSTRSGIAVADGATVTGQDFALDLDIEVGAVAVDTIPELKAVPVGTTVYMLTPTLLAAKTNGLKDGSFFIQSDDRVAGMKLLNPTPALPEIAAGNKVIFKGAIEADPDGGSPVLRVQTIEAKSNSGEPTTLGKVSKGIAPSNTLVKVWGKVTELVDNPNRDNEGEYYIPDPNTGIKVHFWSYDHMTINDGGQNIVIPMYAQNNWMSAAYYPISGLATEHYVSVVGIARRASDGTVVVTPRRMEDITDYNTLP